MFEDEQMGREGHHSLLSMASANPGVSTTVSLNFTPLSSISTVDASIFTVRSTRSEKRHQTCVFTIIKYNTESQSDHMQLLLCNVPRNLFKIDSGLSGLLAFTHWLD